MKKAYRKGAVGAMMDEYERAAAELRQIVEQLSDEEFVRIMDRQTNDENCRSVQTIMAHVIGSGYGYADDLRETFSMPSTRPSKRILSRQESVAQLEAMLEYTVRTLEGRWEMTDDEIQNLIMPARWEGRYDLEQLLEHAIVHILRHRRQIEKFLSQDEWTTQSSS